MGSGGIDKLTTVNVVKNINNKKGIEIMIPSRDCLDGGIEKDCLELIKSIANIKDVKKEIILGGFMGKMKKADYFYYFVYSDEKPHK